LACVRDISEIISSNRPFSASSCRTTSEKFYKDRSWLPWQRNVGQNGS